MRQKDGEALSVVPVSKRAFLLLFFLFALGPDFAHAQVRSGSITVRVSDSENEAPIPQAEVRLYIFGQGNSSYQAYTDGGGGIQFLTVTVAKYRVMGAARDYEPSQDEADVVAGQTSYVLLRLRRRRTAGAPKASGSVSTASLQVPVQAQKELDAGKDALASDPLASIQHFRKAIELYPKFAEAYLFTAIAYLKLQKHDESSKAVDQAIQADPAFSRAHTLRGRLWLEDREFNKAEASLNESLRLDPSSWEAHFELARCYYNLNRVQEAFVQAQQARDLPQSNPVTHLMLADIYLKQNQRKEALAELEAYAQAEPTSPMLPRVQQKIAELRAQP